MPVLLRGGGVRAAHLSVRMPRRPEVRPPRLPPQMAAHSPCVSADTPGVLRARPSALQVRRVQGGIHLRAALTPRAHVLLHRTGGVQTVWLTSRTLPCADHPTRPLTRSSARLSLSLSLAAWSSDRGGLHNWLSRRLYLRAQPSDGGHASHVTGALLIRSLVWRRLPDHGGEASLAFSHLLSPSHTPSHTFSLR